MSNQSFEEKLQELRNFFISTTLPDYMQAITSRWQKLQQDWDQESCRKCIFELHSLKGSSGTLGYDQISDVLNQFIKNLRAIDASSQPPSKLQLVELEVLFASLTFSHQALLNKRQHPTDRHAIAAPKHSLRPITLNPQEIKILIVEHKQSENASIQKQLAEFGFDTHHVHSLNEAKVYVTQYPVELVMLDLAIPNVAADDIYQFAASLEENDIRSFIVSEHDNFELRLGAVNANVSNYVIKPYQVTNLVAKIRSALLLDMMRPFKVLLVDDQPLVASYFKSTLEHHEMEVNILNEPSQILEALVDFEPDIFLLDLYMPKVNGLELAKIIRLLDKYDSIPIVFLTSENSMQTKLQVLECGCDDVLSKNIAPDILVKQIVSRLKRGKTIKYLHSRDSLTGLLNHGQIMEAANNALQQGERRGSSTVIAMIDLDHFKLVNDRYGHAAGDKVIIGLAQLLLQHMRQTDYIGRYGGEEFLIVFPDASIDAIERKINRIRDILSTLQFKHGDSNICVTLSGGIASSDNFDSMASISAAADKALYSAKEKGRNNIQLAKI